MVSEAMANYGTHNKENGQTTMVQNSEFNYLYIRDREDRWATLSDWYTNRHTVTEGLDYQAHCDRETTILQKWQNCKTTVQSEQLFNGLGRVKAEENMSKIEETETIVYVKYLTT